MCRKLALAPLRRHDDAGEMRELRQQRRRGVQELLRPVGGELALEAMDLAACSSGFITIRLSTKNR